MGSDLPLNFQNSDATQALNDFKVVKYIYVAAFVTMVYDTIATIPDEIAYVWKQKRGMGKFLFFSTRWPVIIDGLLYLLTLFKTDLPISLFVPIPTRNQGRLNLTFSCTFEFYWSVWSSLVFFLPLQVVVTLRTIALWERNQKVVILLITTAAATDLCLVSLLARLSQQMSYSPNQSPAIRNILGCWLDSVDIDSRAMLPCWAMYCTFDTVIFTLTLIRGVKIYKVERPTGSLFRVLIFQGFAYYCVMLAISTAALIMNSLPTLQRRVLIFALAPVLKASFCIIGSRISLHLRQTQKTRSSSFILRDSVRLSSLLASKPSSSSLTPL